MPSKLRMPRHVAAHNVDLAKVGEFSVALARVVGGVECFSIASDAVIVIAQAAIAGERDPFQNVTVELGPPTFRRLGKCGRRGAHANQEGPKFTH